MRTARRYTSAKKIAIIYTAHVLGASLGGNASISIYHQIDGVSEETANAGIDLLDGNEYKAIVVYQNGLQDGHIGSNVPFYSRISFASAQAEQMYNIADSVINGEKIKEWNASGQTITLKYDLVKTRLYVTF